MVHYFVNLRCTFPRSVISQTSPLNLLPISYFLPCSLLKRNHFFIYFPLYLSLSITNLIFSPFLILFFYYLLFTFLFFFSQPSFFCLHHFFSPFVRQYLTTSSPHLSPLSFCGFHLYDSRLFSFFSLNFDSFLFYFLLTLPTLFIFLSRCFPFFLSPFAFFLSSFLSFTFFFFPFYFVFSFPLWLFFFLFLFSYAFFFTFLPTSFHSFLFFITSFFFPSSSSAFSHLSPFFRFSFFLLYLTFFLNLLHSASLFLSSSFSS